LTDRGMFQCVIHFSSSRATVWFVDDLYRYRMLDQEALGDADICLAYPLTPYPADACVPQDAIRPILERMRDLRWADDTFYLRSASINIFNGMISLTFSCDGSQPFVIFVHFAFICRRIAVSWVHPSRMTSGSLRASSIAGASGFASMVWIGFTSSSRRNFRSATRSCRARTP
jgi:hypothetical protein